MGANNTFFSFFLSLRPSQLTTPKYNINSVNSQALQIDATMPRTSNGPTTHGSFRKRRRATSRRKLHDVHHGHINTHPEKRSRSKKCDERKNAHFRSAEILSINVNDRGTCNFMDCYPTVVSPAETFLNEGRTFSADDTVVVKFFEEDQHVAYNVKEEDDKEKDKDKDGDFSRENSVAEATDDLLPMIENMSDVVCTIAETVFAREEKAIYQLEKSRFQSDLNSMALCETNDYERLVGVVSKTLIKRYKDILCRGIDKLELYTLRNLSIE